MGRLIDADALKDALGISDKDIEFAEMLDEQPTVDAQSEIDRLNRLGLTWYDTILKLMEMVNGTEPVKHGKWNRVSAITGECSVCGELECDYEEYNYCPHCGAKMDAEEDGKCQTGLKEH